MQESLISFEINLKHLVSPQRPDLRANTRKARVTMPGVQRTASALLSDSSRPLPTCSQPIPIPSSPLPLRPAAAG
ncbi:hypothetical protein BCAR13_60154 [Paraburkholderia caribensis]|nr:hypothetical protein BCAR13_60154 [Paraburkholderia caribensis]